MHLFSGRLPSSDPFRLARRAEAATASIGVDDGRTIVLLLKIQRAPEHRAKSDCFYPLWVFQLNRIVGQLAPYESRVPMSAYLARAMELGAGPTERLASTIS
jgi:hypothetical protein